MSALCTIPLTGGGFAIVDEADYADLSRYKWSNSNGYASRRARYRGSRKTVLMHRVVIGAEPGTVVDHINRNPLDNRRANLRIVSCSESNMNQRAASHRRHGIRFKGVYKNRSGSTYSAKLRGQHIGNFRTERAAAEAYNAAALAMFGDLVFLNAV